MAQQIVEAEVNIAGYVIPHLPNTLEYNDGSGDQTVRVASVGNGAVFPVYSNNVENNKGMVKFQTFATADLISAVETFKQLRNNILITLSLKLTDGKLFTKTFPKMALVNHPTVQLQSDGNIALEFEGAPAI